MIHDSFGRNHNYLRISLTDVCNFRCTYCMPKEDMSFMPSARLMQADEIGVIAREFVKLGVDKIRLTGGEPLARKDFATILKELAVLPVELTLTTNGYLLDKYLTQLLDAGVKSVNISLDSLQADKFYKITQRNYFDKVYQNIFLAVQNGLHVKVNTVLMRGVNDDEIIDFVNMGKNLLVHIRFIEFMPFDKNEWEKQKVFSYQEILQVVSQQLEYLPIKGDKNDTAKKFKVLNYAGTFAVISTMTAPFCAGCNRMRLTADGKMKNCLFSNGEANLLSALRNQEDIVPIIKQCVWEKKEALGGQLDKNYQKIDIKKLNNRSMIAIGG
jgi:cyclic pyranopterin phosphate synthase